MALRQREPIRMERTGPGPVMVFLQRNRFRLVIAAGVIVAVLLVTAVVQGMHRNSDLKASQLFSQAKTIEDFEAILKQVPKSYLTYDILINLGSLSHNAGKREDALKYYDEAYRGFPQGFRGAAALCAMGALNKEAKEYAKAAVLFSRAVDTEPLGIKAAEALVQWGECLEASGDVSGAREKYSRVAEQFPTSPLAKEAANKIR